MIINTNTNLFTRHVHQVVSHLFPFPFPRSSSYRCVEANPKTNQQLNPPPQRRVMRCVCGVAVSSGDRWRVCAHHCDATMCTVGPHRCSSSGRSWRSSSGGGSPRRPRRPFLSYRTNEPAVVRPCGHCGATGAGPRSAVCHAHAAVCQHDDDGPALTVPLAVCHRCTAQFPPPTRPSLHRVARAPVARPCVDLVAPASPHHVRIRCPRRTAAAAAARPQVEQQAQPRCRRCQGKESAHAVRGKTAKPATQRSTTDQLRLGESACVRSRQRDSHRIQDF